MKKSILSTVAILLCLSTASYAQNIKKGTIEVGGGLGIGMNSEEFDVDGASDDMEVKSTSFSASTLYYIRPNIGIGGTWDYVSREYDLFGNKMEYNDYSIGPIISYNISMDKQIGFKLQGGAVKYFSETSVDGSKFEFNGFVWLAKGVISYFITKNISFNGSVAYTFGEIELETNIGDADTDYSNFTSHVGISVYLN